MGHGSSFALWSRTDGQELVVMKFWLIVLIPVAIIMSVIWVFERRCPECGREGVLRITGNTREKPELRTSLWHPPVTQNVFSREYQCKRCGHTLWKDERPFLDG